MKWTMIAVGFLLALLLVLTACSQNEQVEKPETPTSDSSLSESSGNITSEATQSQEQGEAAKMRIQVEAGENRILFELNDTRAARDLYEQLPLRIQVEDYSTNEKIFYPPEKLDVSGAPRAGGGAGTLAYYEPWGDVVIFYDAFDSAEGLYLLGEAISGIEYISDMSNTIIIEQAND